LGNFKLPILRKLILPLLYYDYSGFWLISRKLAKGYFKIKEHERSNVVEIDRNQLERQVKGMAYESEFIPRKAEKSAKKKAVFI